MIKDYKYLVDKKPKLTIFGDMFLELFIFGATGWGMCIYILDKLC